MGWFSRSKQKSEKTDQDLPEPDPVPWLPVTPQPPHKDPAPYSSSQSPVQTKKLTTRASQPSFLSPISEIQDDDRARNNSSRASRRQGAGNRARDISITPWISTPQPASTPVPGAGSRVLDQELDNAALRDRIRMQSERINELERELRSASQRLQISDAMRAEERNQQAEELDAAHKRTDVIVNEMVEQGAFQQAQHEAEIQKLRKELDDFKSRIQRSDTLRTAASSKAREQTEQIEIMEQTMNMLRKESHRAKHSLDQKSALVSDMREELREKNMDLEGIKIILRKQKEEAEASRKKVSSLEERMESQKELSRKRIREIQAREDSMMRTYRDSEAELRKEIDNIQQNTRSQIEEIRQQSARQMVELHAQKQTLQNETEARIRDLEQALQEKTSSLEETRLTLNRTRNELNDEKRKARLAVGESAEKSQQMEFVQQQCALLQEKLTLVSSINKMHTVNTVVK
jgi:chromosome segregation ATPase